MAQCLVLGANGFIGSHVVDSLVEQGHSVRAFDRFGADTLFKQDESIEIFRGNFLNSSDRIEALNGVDYVFHFISTTTPASAENDPTIDIETNVRETVELLQECVEAGIKRVIFASTGGAIYGGKGDKPHTENDLTLPISPYAIGKLTIEHYLRYFRVKHKLDSVILRISNPYGERQPFHRKQGVIPIFLERMYRGEQIVVLGDGSMVRDYVYVKDVANMAVHIFDKSTKENTYNIGSGSGSDINNLIHVIESVCMQKAKIVHRPTPSTFLHKVILDTSRFTNEFGPISLTDLKDGIAKTYQYIKHEVDNE